MSFPSLPATSILCCLLAFVSASCANPDPLRPVAGAGSAPATIQLTPSDARKIGQKIWNNECSGTVEGLTSWNRGEDFASLGIGHFIWYTRGNDGPFDESWPKLVAFMKQRRVVMPGWIATTADCPWPTYEAFQADRNSVRMQELRGFLANTIEVQTDFIVQRLQSALPKMRGAATGAAERDRLTRNFYAVAESGSGVYALIDYVNFKGEGVKKEERYQGQGWGLAQVLLEMQGEPQGIAAAREFGAAAKRVLQRRVRNAPPARNESRWLAGWMNRCSTYGRPL